MARVCGYGSRKWRGVRSVESKAPYKRGIILDVEDVRTRHGAEVSRTMLTRTADVLLLVPPFNFEAHGSAFHHQSTQGYYLTYLHSPAQTTKILGPSKTTILGCSRGDMQLPQRAGPRRALAHARVLGTAGAVHAS